jgi:hypothetical protein
MDVFRWNRGPKPKHHLSDKERDLAARPRGRKAEKEYPLDPKADNHTKGNKIPSATKSTTALDVSGLTRYYAPLPAPDYHGPNFEKGPLQAEIRQESGMMSIWNSDTNIQNVPYRPKFRGRAHSVHGPIFHHHLQCPYEILPEKCTPQIYAEYREYKRLSDAERVHKKAVGEVNGGLSKLTADDREKAIIDGISHAKAAENQEKLLVCHLYLE